MDTLILEFVERDDFVADLMEYGVHSVRLEIETETGKPHGEFSNRSHTVKAIATALRATAYKDAPVIVRWKMPILVTDSISMSMGNGKEDSREKMFANFEFVCQKFRDDGFTVRRGQWKTN